MAISLAYSRSLGFLIFFVNVSDVSVFFPNVSFGSF